MRPQRILILLFGLTISIGSFSQLSVGPEIGRSIGKTQIGPVGFGSSIRYEASIKNKFSWTCSIGYLSFSNQSHMYGFPTQAKIVPILGGIKYYFSKPRKGFYAFADLGLTLINITSYEPAPFSVVLSQTHPRTGFSSGLGYRSNRWDLSARYSLFAWLYDERYDSRMNANYLSFRVAYILGAK